MATLENYLIGLRNPVSVDVSSGDVTPSINVRGITVTGAGIIKATYSNGNTVDFHAEPGIQYYVAGLVTIKSSASGTTATGIVVWE